MSGGEPVPPETDRAIGLEFYASSGPGFGALVKGEPEDFQVREVSLYPMPDPKGPYTVLNVVSRGREQHELAEELASRLGLPLHSVSWAGTKDRRAIAERLFSYRGLPPTTLPTLRNAEVLEAYRARDHLVLGHHYGNAFTIRLRDLRPSVDVAHERFSTVRSELVEAGGFPNFFGPQRFGEVRPVTHLVGRDLVRGDVAGAIDTYLSAPAPGESTLGQAARRSYAEHHDPRRALEEFPAPFRFERTLLERLARGDPPERAFRALHRELRMLFVHAFQALLFNRWLGERRRGGLSLDVPTDGDTVLRVRRDGTVPGTDPIAVSADNVEECGAWVRRGGARLAGPLIGFETPAASGVAGELIDRLLADEAVTRESFELPGFPELASHGSWRPSVAAVPPIGTHWDATGPEESRSGSVRLTFALPKGTYATVLLREFLKPGAVHGVR